MARAKRSVFDLYAHEYDLMTAAAQRETYHRKEVQALVDRFAPGRVLDAGCAAGLTARLFAETGIEAVGLDRSRAMVTVAQQKHAGTSLPLSFRTGRFEKLPNTLHGRFDLVVCLANAIAGVDGPRGLRDAMRGFHRVLAPGGSLVLQMLNFGAAPEGELMPIRATEHEGIVYLRYARREGRRFTLHVVRLDISPISPPSSLN